MRHNLYILPALWIANILQAAPTTLSLKQAIQYGVEHSPRMESAIATRENAKLELANAEAQFLPRLQSDASASLRYTTSPEFAPRGPTDSRSIGLSINHNLWDGGIRSFARDAARSRVHAAELDYTLARDQLVLDIVKAFYDLSESTLAIQSQVEHQKLLERQAHDIDVAFRQGLSLKRDAVRMQTDLQRQELVVIAATDQATRAKERLITMIGAAQDGSEFVFQTFQPHETSAFNAVLIGNGDSTLDIQQTTTAKRQRIDEETAKYTLEGERRRRTWPAIDLSIGSDYHLNESGGKDLPRTFSRDGVNWSATVGVRYTIWDWGTREREIAIILNDQRKARAERSSAFAEMQQKITDVKRVREQSEKNLKLNAALLKLEEESNATMVRDFKQGRISYLDLMDASQKLSAARLAHSKSYFDWQRSAWEFKYYAGGLFDVVQSL